MRILKHNVRVTDPEGRKVVLHGGDVLPEWARVSRHSVTEVADVEDEPSDYGVQVEVPHGDGSVSLYAHSRVVDAYGFPEPDVDES